MRAWWIPQTTLVGSCFLECSPQKGGCCSKTEAPQCFCSCEPQNHWAANFFNFSIQASPRDFITTLLPHSIVWLNAIKWNRFWKYFWVEGLNDLQTARKVKIWYGLRLAILPVTVRNSLWMSSFFKVLGIFPTNSLVFGSLILTFRDLHSAISKESSCESKLS